MPRSMQTTGLERLPACNRVSAVPVQKCYRLLPRYFLSSTTGYSLRTKEIATLDGMLPTCKTTARVRVTPVPLSYHSSNDTKRYASISWQCYEHCKSEYREKNGKQKCDRRQRQNGNSKKPVPQKQTRENIIPTYQNSRSRRAIMVLKTTFYRIILAVFTSLGTFTYSPFYFLIKLVNFS